MKTIPETADNSNSASEASLGDEVSAAQEGIGDDQADDGRTLADQAYDGIVDLILGYQLRPGEHTSVSRLADRLGLGRTPVKEAIVRLEVDGILSVTNRSSTSVNKIDVKTAEQLFALRNLLEDFAVEDVVEYVTKQDLRDLRQLLEQLKWPRVDSSGFHKDIAKYVRSNVRFHATIMRCARNRTLDHLYAQIQLQAQIVIYLYRMETGHKDQAISAKYLEHAAIFHALEKRDADALRRLLREHAATTEESVLKSLRALSSL